MPMKLEHKIHFFQGIFLISENRPDNSNPDTYPDKYLKIAASFFNLVKI